MYTSKITLEAVAGAFNSGLTASTKILISIMIIFPIMCLAQIGDYHKYADISSSEYYDVDVLQDIKYAVGKTNYQKLDDSGSYQTISQINLELDLFVPATPASEGKRAVIIMIPGSGRGGCREGVRYLENGNIDTENGCSQLTELNGAKVIKEGFNYNHVNNSTAQQYAKRGFIVASVNTRYNYQHTDFVKNGSNRWYRSADGTDDGTNPATLLNLGSAHLEYMVVDLKRVMRWLTANAGIYNIDPNYIFINGSSGAAKMASITAITNEDQLIVDDPSNINYAFEAANNNWGIRNSTPGIKGAILRKGDTNGLSNLKLMDTMSANTDSFMFWTGTADKSILHGMSEVMEEKCEILQTCSTQLFSLSNKTHGSASSATFPHPALSDQSYITHTYDFMVNAIHKDSKNLPVISVSQSAVSFDESVGTAQIKIERSGNANNPITFTVTADQMREVTRENGTLGSFDLITRYVAKSANSDGLVMYNESTGYAYEDAFGGDLRKTSDKVLKHTSGKGEGEYTEISSADNRYHDTDFTGKTQVMTMAAGQNSINFNVTIKSDDMLEQNECFNVRLLNAYGATIGNSVEVITIKDDDTVNPDSSAVCANPGEIQEPVLGGDFVLDVREISYVGESSQSVYVQVALNEPLDEDALITYRTWPRTASESTDYNGVVSEQKIIYANRNSTFLKIDIQNDSIREPNEEFIVKILDIDNSKVQLRDTVGYVIVIDDD